MRVLIVWGNLTPKKELRNTVVDYIYSFPKYDKDDSFFILNIPWTSSSWNYEWIKEGMFDVVLFTCTFLGIRWNEDRWKLMWDTCERVFGPLSCRKVIMPQDDYDNTAKLWEFVRRVKVDDIYTVLPEANHEIIYPKNKIGNARIKVILTGYVEEKYLNWKFPPKTLDVIYRANKLPYKFGRLGQRKTELIDVFLPKLNGLKTDIKNTIKKEDIYCGNSWIEHLAMARCVLGCVSGSSIMDPEGDIGKTFDAYRKEYPDSSYDEAKKVCFPDLKENLVGALGPRNFEAAITRTCQVLVRADYSGVLKEDIDYIPIDEDYGNIDEVVEKIKDITYCQKIADNCYKNLIESGLYTYRSFVTSFMEEMHDGEKTHAFCKSERFIRWKCAVNNQRVNTYITLRDFYGFFRQKIVAIAERKNRRI